MAKCSTISFSGKRQSLIYSYCLDGHAVERLEHVKVLGVIFDFELNFRMHYENILAKANQQLGIIFKVADGFDNPSV